MSYFRWRSSAGGGTITGRQARANKTRLCGGAGFVALMGACFP